MTGLQLHQDLRAQYDVHKATHPEALIGFAMGDFVEFFFDDAITVAGSLGIVLTKRGKYHGEPIPMAGIPAARVSHYVDCLHASGHTVHVHETSSDADHGSGSEVVPVEWASISPDMQQEVIRECQAYEKRQLRAAALHERLVEHGLAKEAEVLRMRDMVGNLAVNRDAQLDALEEIVCVLEQGPAAALTDALHTGAGTEAALRLLRRLHDPAGAAATAERLAIMVIAKSDDERHAFRLGDDERELLIEQLSALEEGLLNRLEIARFALDRVRSASAMAKPLQ